MFTQKIIQEFLHKEKVIMHKSRGGVSIIEQDTIECVLGLFKIKNSLCFFKKKISFFYLHFMQLFSADSTNSFSFFLPMKTLPSKVDHNGPIFFSVLPNGP